MVQMVHNFQLLNSFFVNVDEFSVIFVNLTSFVFHPFCPQTHEQDADLIRDCVPYDELVFGYNL